MRDERVCSHLLGWGFRLRDIQHPRVHFYFGRDDHQNTARTSLEMYNEVVAGGQGAFIDLADSHDHGAMGSHFRLIFQCLTADSNVKGIRYWKA